MSSKSSSSIVKSVESVVKSVMPKNMNMKHVLLAVLVGLLLCMLMGNTVEPFSAPYENPEVGYCMNYNSGSSSKLGCRGRTDGDKTGSDLICSTDKAEDVSASALGDTCGTNGTVITRDEFCYDFRDNLSTPPDENNPSCNIGEGLGGNSDVCEMGSMRNTVNCSGLTNLSCPGSPDLSEDAPKPTPDQESSCKWENCSGFATGTEDVKDAFNFPQLNDSLKRWANCVENNIVGGVDGKWNQMKLSSKGDPLATNSIPGGGISAAWTGDKWGIGVSTGKPYIGEGAADLRLADVRTLKPLVYKGPEGVKKAYTDEMFPSQKWSDLIDEKVKFCGAQLGDDLSSITVPQALDKGAIVGFNSDKSGLICLNKNDAIETHVTQTRVDLIKAPGCGDPNEEKYCSTEGLYCAAGSAGPTSAQEALHAEKCDLGQVTATINQVENRAKKGYKDATDAVKEGIHKTCGTITGFTGLL